MHYFLSPSEPCPWEWCPTEGPSLPQWEAGGSGSLAPAPAIPRWLCAAAGVGLSAQPWRGHGLPTGHTAAAHTECCACLHHDAGSCVSHWTDGDQAGVHQPVGHRAGPEGAGWPHPALHVPGLGVHRATGPLLWRCLACWLPFWQGGHRQTAATRPQGEYRGGMIILFTHLYLFFNFNFHCFNFVCGRKLPKHSAQILKVLTTCFCRDARQGSQRQQSKILSLFLVWEWDPKKLALHGKCFALPWMSRKKGIDKWPQFCLLSNK